MSRLPLLFKAFLLATAVLSASSCSTFLRSDVVTFHEGPLPNGERIRVQALDPDKARSLEFRRYAGLIADELSRIGYTPVDAMDAPVDLVAEVDYSIAVGPTEVRVDRSIPYARYHFYYGRFANPYYFGIHDGWEPQVYTTASYLRTLQMNIVQTDEAKSRIFEGRVQSTGTQNNLPEIMPYLITALFANYPGESGVTKVVTIEMDE